MAIIYKQPTADNTVVFEAIPFDTDAGNLAVAVRTIPNSGGDRKNVVWHFGYNRAADGRLRDDEPSFHFHLETHYNPGSPQMEFIWNYTGVTGNSRRIIHLNMVRSDDSLGLFFDVDKFYISSAFNLDLLTSRLVMTVKQEIRATAEALAVSAPGNPKTFSIDTTYNFLSMAGRGKICDLNGGNGITSVLTLGHNLHTGLPTKNFGAAIQFQAQSNGANDRNVARVAATWDDVADATRSGSMSILIGNAAGEVAAAKFDDDDTPGNTRLLLYDVDSGQLSRVSVGDPDSGGEGYKLLRVAN